MAKPKVRFEANKVEWTLSSYSNIAKNFKYGLNAAAIMYDGKNKYLRITDIDDETRCFIQSQLTTPGADLSHSDEYLLQEGDIAFARTGASVGKSFIYHEDEGKVFFAGFLIRMKTSDNVLPDFIFQNSLTGNFAKHIRIVSQRSGQPGVNVNELKAYEFFLPTSKIEQQQIASYFKLLDTLIQETTKKISSLRQLKSASLQSMFPQAGETKPRVRFKGFNEEWKRVIFSDLYERSVVKNDLTYRADKIISVANMYYNNSTVSNIDYLKTYNVMKLGDIAFEGNKSKYFAHGRFVENTIGDGIVSHVFVVFKPKSIKYDLNYWEYFINNEWVMRKILLRCTKSSTMMTDLVVNDFLKETVLVPAVEEQKLIGSFFKQLDSVISLETQHLDKLKQIKSACLDKMFV